MVLLNTAARVMHGAARADAVYLGATKVWPRAVGYLNALAGTATLPDPGPLPTQSVFVYKVRGPLGAGSQVIAAVWPTNGNSTWYLRRWADTAAIGSHRVAMSATGSTSTPVFATNVNPTMTPGADEELAVSFDIAASTTVQVWQRVSGTWSVLLASTLAGGFTPFDATAPVTIGTYLNSVTDAFNGRIYWVECRTGTNPAAGTVLWRFDATEAPVTFPAAVFDDTLDSDANADGTADGYAPHAAGGAVNFGSRSIVGGAQRIVAAPTVAGAAYGVETSPRITIAPSRTYTVTMRYTGQQAVSGNAQLWMQCYTSGGAGTGSAVQITPPLSATPALVNAFITAPADAAQLRIIPRIVATGTPTGANPYTLDVYQITVRQDYTYTDPRGQRWTLNNPVAVVRL